MKTNPNKLWIIVIALGWVFDFLVWKQAPGVNFAIFATFCLIAAFYLLLSNGLRPHRTIFILLPLFGFFAVVTFVRAEPMTTFLAITFTLLVMTILAMTYLGGRWIQYTVSDFVSKAVALIGSLVYRPISFTLEARKVQAEAGIKPSKYNFWPVLRGLVIALPIVAIFASLLSSADVVFGQRLEDFIELFRLEKLPEYIFRLVYILVIGYALAGVVLHASSESRDEKLVGEDKPVIPAFLVSSSPRSSWEVSLSCSPLSWLFNSSTFLAGRQISTWKVLPIQSTLAAGSGSWSRWLSSPC